MLATSQDRRLRFLAWLLMAGFVVLGARLVWLQSLDTEEINQRTQKKVRSRRVVSQIEVPRRGSIYDCRLVELAANRISLEVAADPSVLGQGYSHAARLLAPLLDCPEDRLLTLLRPRMGSNGKTPLRYVNLRPRVEAQVREGYLKGVNDLREELSHTADWSSEDLDDFIGGIRRGIVFKERQDRYYSHGSLASHVVGAAVPRRDVEGAEWEDKLTGVAGVERSMDAFLRGSPGWREVVRFRRREVLTEKEREVPARPGYNVVLTLDLALQAIVERAMEETWTQYSPEGISVVVVQPRSGRVLAMANLPTFDPNRLEESPARDWRNRAIAFMADPGSTFKPLTIGAALNEGVITLDTMIDCTPNNSADKKYYFRERTQGVRDDHFVGKVSAAQVLAQSSNIGAAKIGVYRLEYNRRHSLRSYMRRFGLGAPTGIPLPGELAGLLSFEPSAVVGNSYGYSVDVTPLQMTMAIAAIANGGRLMRPMLVDRLMDYQGRVVTQFHPKVVREVLSPEAARQVTEAMVLAVNEGTGKQARLEKYVVAGKTGTAQRRILESGYSRSRHLASFVGFFPAQDPQVLIYVSVDQPRGGMYGGTVAGPLWRRIAEQAASSLGITPQAPVGGSEVHLAGARSTGRASEVRP